MTSKLLASRSLLALTVAALLAVCIWMSFGLFGCAQQQRIEDANAVIADPASTPEQVEAAEADLAAAGAEVDQIATGAGATGGLIIPPPFNLLAPAIAAVIAAGIKGKD